MKVNKALLFFCEAHFLPFPPQSNSRAFLLVEGIIMTQEQKQTLKEFDAQQEKLENQLKALLERRREYINTRELNNKVGIK